jgi:hypothetical protein
MRSCPIALVVLLAGCAQHIYSPPARGMPLEGSRSLATDENALMLEAGESGALFGPDFAVAGIRYRHGFSEQLEGSAELGLLRVTTDGDTTTHRNAYAARAAVKYALVKWVAFVGGLGGGAHDAGGFLSPDLGVLVSGENKYVVPNLSVRTFVSQPIAAQRVDLGFDDNDEIGRVTGEPRFSYGFSLGSSLRIPMWRCDALTHSLYGGFTLTRISDGEKALGILGLSAGFEMVF